MFKGTLIALITPFQDDINKSVDYESLEKLLDFQLNSQTNNHINERDNTQSKANIQINKKNNVQLNVNNQINEENNTQLNTNNQVKENINELVICASTGEGTLLSNNERIEIIKFVIKSINNKIPVIVGCSSCSTIESIKNIKIASDLGANGVLVTSPYYVKPNQEGIFKHFENISNNTDIPVIVYNIPSRVSVNIELETLKKIFNLKNIVALKDSTKNFETLSILHNEMPHINILSGDDGTLPACLAHGACGAVSAAANVFPKEISNIIDSWNSNNIKKFKEDSEILPYISKAISVTTNPIPIKYILSKMKIIKNIVREPLCIINNEQKILLDTLLNTINNLTKY